MARPIKSNDGKRATQKITLSVTDETFENYKILAELTHKGNLNALICGVMDNAVKNNLDAIRKIRTARKAYQTQVLKASSEVTLDFILQSPQNLPVQDSQDSPIETTPDTLAKPTSDIKNVADISDTSVVDDDDTANVITADANKTVRQELK